jgi:peptidoglycan/xylan/chitin deacetylase (PgdA/CDA1 family)
MLTYKKTRWFFLITFALATVASIVFKFPWFYLLVFPLLYFIILGIGSAFIGLGFFIKSICKAETNEKIIALTFDDGPDVVNTPKILEILKSHQLKACFFIIGKKIKGNEELVRKISLEGHIVANHSFSHSYFYDFYSTKKVTADILMANDIIKDTIGVTPKLFRPPYGVTNPNIAKGLEKLGLNSIGWNIRSLDTVIQDPGKLLRRVIYKIKPGSILLFHDTGAGTIETLKEVILFTKKNGYKIAGLNELLKLNTYEEL